ncbi:MAG: c-type cytochrome [Oceanococcaceae bacterium]
MRAISLMTLMALSFGSAAAAPPEAAACAACHGKDGKSVNPAWPNLNGQNKPYLVSSLKAYRDGSRNNPLMSPMAKSLSDEAIDALADYYSSQ